MLLAVIGGVFFVLTAVGTAWQVGLAISAHEGAAAAESAVVGVLVLVFWRWITLGAWLRYRPPLDPETGLPLREEAPVGPWGIVGRILMALIVIVFVGGAVWASTRSLSATREARRVEDRAELAARAQHLTVADVQAAERELQTWLATGGSGPDPIDELLDVDGAVVRDVSVEHSDAAILLVTDESPPCVVVNVDRNDLISTHLTSDCT